MTETASETDSVVKILGLHHAGIPCNDLDRAVEFYTQVLGLEVIGAYRSSDGRPHFLGANLPQEVKVEDAQAERDFQEYVANYQAARPGKTPQTDFVRLSAGHTEVVLFQRLEPEERDTLIQNGIFHQSYHISKEDMARLTELKRQGGSGIRFHTGPALRWPHGRAMYLWDTEGNYIELESQEDLRAELGVK